MADKTIRKKLLTGFFAVLACVMLISTGHVNAAAVTGQFEGHPIYDNHFGMKLDENDNAKTKNNLKKYGAYQSKYDPRTLGLTTAIEDQGNTNTCWAFATISAIEMNLIKKGYANNSINLSENHLAYFLYNRAVDPLGYTAGDRTDALRYVWYNNSGNLWTSAEALATWAGVVNQTESEDTATGEYSPHALPASQCYNSDYRVKDAIFLEYDIDTVKAAVMNYGAVATGVEINTAGYKKATASYYTTSDRSNHAVTIVGWDDNWAVSNFNENPGRPGAWIVKNSYGKNFGDHGYMYISYYDKSLDELIAYDMEPASQSYRYNYQYDGSANPSYSLKMPNGSYVANEFIAKGSRNKFEDLKAVSIDTRTSNVNYSLQIYTGLTNYANPLSGTPAFSTPQTGTLTHAGINRITLNQPVSLVYGDRYSVVIRLSAPGTDRVSLCIDKSYNFGWVNFTAYVSPGQGFLSNGNGWSDVGYNRGANLRIKAYTDISDNQIAAAPNTKYAAISKGSYTVLKLNSTSPYFKRNVYWTSLNNNVARVYSNGAVVGVGYGSTYVVGRFYACGRVFQVATLVTVGPKRIRYVVGQGRAGTLALKWLSNGDAKGYVIYYSKERTTGYSALGVAGNTNYFIKRNVPNGDYYIIIKPVGIVNGRYVFGDATNPIKVSVR